MKKNDIIVLFMRIYAASFLVVGLIFLWTPNGLIHFFNDLGDGIGMFADVPDTGALLWLSLSVAYMATVTLLALFIQSDPAGNKKSLWALTVAKGVSAGTSLAFYFGNAKGFLYLVNGVTDGSIALLCLVFLSWLRGGKKG